MKHQRKRRFEITLSGFIFGAVILFVLASAINSQANLLFFAFGLMLGAMLVSALIGALMLRCVDAVRLLADHAEAGQPAEVHYEISNHKKRWPCFALHLTEAFFVGTLDQVPDGYCLHVGPGEKARVITFMKAGKRGVVELRDLRFSCAFPFGFLRRAIHLVRPQRIVVYPRIGIVSRELALRCRQAMPGGTSLTDQRGGHDEFYGLREYRAGDSMRSVHWRRTARTGEMIVREMTNDSPPQLQVVLNLRSWRDLPDGLTQAERAIEVAASIVCHGFLLNYAVGLSVAGAGGGGGEKVQTHPPRPGREQRALLLEALSLLELKGDHALSKGTTPAATSGMSYWDLNTGAIRGGVCWLVVTLTGQDAVGNLTAAGAVPVVLALDAPGSESWIGFAQKVAGSEPV